MQIQPQLEESWKNILAGEFEKPYFQNIKSQLIADIENKITLYPPIPLIFNAFEHTTFSDLKVVILGQDPYHGAGQAHGLSFSVQKGVKTPPSLKNMYKELHLSGCIDSIPEHGDLSPWTDQGVLLLNAILTVQAGNPASHSKIGWEDFTDAVIQKISQEKTGVVFLLWGAFAQSKAKFIAETKHHIISTTHPSPFSAHRGFLGSNCFKECNDILKQQGQQEIDWQI